MLNKLVVDIARYTEGVDPIPLHEASVQLVILKVDDLFERNGRIFTNAGMPIAAYHWIDPTRDAAQQVAESLEVIRKSNLPVRAIFPDFEQYWSNWTQWYRAIQKQLAWNLVGRFGGEKLSNHAKQVFEGFAAAGAPTIGYTRASFVREYTPQAAQWMPRYKWWLAHYKQFGAQVLTWDALKNTILPTVNFFPDLPAGLTKDHVVGHQFTGDELSLPGLYGDILRTQYSRADVNLFDGAFLAQIGAVPNPKPLPALQYEAVVTASPNLNVRTGPATTFPVLYKLNKGAPVQISRMTDNWAKLRSYGEEWCSAQYLRILTAVDPEEEEDDEVVIPDPVEVHFNGMTYRTMRRFNANCHVLICDMVGQRFHVTPYTGMKTVTQAARQLGAKIVVNGDGWGINGRFPNSIAASDGRFYQRFQLDYRPWINIARDNSVSFAWRLPRNLYNAISGDRYLIDLGRYNQAISNVTKDPRTVIGYTRDRKIVIMVADGRTPQSAGLSFRECADILLEFGVVTAINLDGGGSSAMWIHDRIVNVPIEANVPGRERAVANHLCIFVD
jgi:GH25 family lysozyme M1 (1,4-beta-N-acetylmuramidase)